MRTPNTSCVLCEKPLYRRPSDMAKTRYAACMACRGKAQSVAGLTIPQQVGLSWGREKGTNHRTGYKHRAVSKAKASLSHQRWCAENPDRVRARGEKTRGERHYRWKGGVTRLNISIRQMRENRKWMDAVKARDGCCGRCGSTEKLEVHHVKSLAALIEECGVRNRDDARKSAAILWDLANGETLCEPCHYREHGRKKPPISRRRRRALAQQEARA